LYNKGNYRLKYTAFKKNSSPKILSLSYALAVSKYMHTFIEGLCYIYQFTLFEMGQATLINTITTQLCDLIQNGLKEEYKTADTFITKST